MTRWLNDKIFLMREILSDVTQWMGNGEAVAIATVVQTWGSAPRGVGSKMAMTADNRISGSVSGGCVEGAVFETGLQVLETGTPQLLHFGVADETAWEVGLACGGTIEVFVEKLTPELLAFWQAAVVNEKAIAVGTVIGGNSQVLGQQIFLDELERDSGVGLLGDQIAAVPFLTVEALASSQPKRIKTSDELDVFIDVQLPQPQLIVIGGGHIAIALTQLAKIIGYKTVVIDPRSAFVSAERFPHVDHLIPKWPSEALKEIAFSRNTAVAALTHDPKIDDKALIAALQSNAFYVGALGSKKTHAQRVARLKEAGLNDDAIQNMHAPIGLEIGAKTPEEIALAVMAEIVKAGANRR
ncbi:MAG: XdhC family protein [Anaerolineae bacterium]|nr:XdhC family protein [Anaerolineae bacterium]